MSYNKNILEDSETQMTPIKWGNYSQYLPKEATFYSNNYDQK